MIRERAIQSREVIDGAMVCTAARWDNIRNLSILDDRAPIRKQRLSNIGPNFKIISSLARDEIEDKVVSDRPVL
jgi:hypothetical protein